MKDVTMDNPLWKRFVTLRRIAVDCEDFSSFMLQDELVNKCSWAVTKPGCLAAIKNFVENAGICEIGAGTGYWGYVLKQMEIDVVCYDLALIDRKGGRKNRWHNSRKTWTQIKQGHSGSVRLHPDRVLMLCYPPNKKPMALNALRLFRGSKLVYIGEGRDGRTGSRRFHDALDTEWNKVGEILLPKWPHRSYRHWCWFYQR